MEQSPSWEANRFWATQEIPRNLWNRKVHHRIQKSLSLYWARSIESKTPIPLLWYILILSSYLRLRLHKDQSVPEAFVFGS